MMLGAGEDLQSTEDSCGGLCSAGRLPKCSAPSEPPKCCQFHGQDGCCLPGWHQTEGRDRTGQSG